MTIELKKLIKERPQLFEAIESKLIRHGYSYIGNDILASVVEWIESHYLFKGYTPVLSDKSRRQTKVTLEGFYESR